jgi:hypothetical protein
MTPNLQRQFNGMFLFWMAAIGWRLLTSVQTPNRFSAFAIPVSGG